MGPFKCGNPQGIAYRFGGEYLHWTLSSAYFLLGFSRTINIWQYWQCVWWEAGAMVQLRKTNARVVTGGCFQKSGNSPTCNSYQAKAFRIAGLGGGTQF